MNQQAQLAIKVYTIVVLVLPNRMRMSLSLEKKQHWKVTSMHVCLACYLDLTFYLMSVIISTVSCRSSSKLRPYLLKSRDDLQKNLSDCLNICTHAEDAAPVKQKHRKTRAKTSRHWNLHSESLQYNQKIALSFENKHTKKKNEPKKKIPEHMFRSPTMDWNTSHWHAFDPCTFNKQMTSSLRRRATGHDRKLLVLYTPPLRGYWEKQGVKK